MVREMDFVDEYYADKNLSLLKKLTIVIPTYNRNYYLSRCLWYHAHFPFGKIIVADSSPEEKKVVNRETVAKVREMFGADVLYLEYEPETEKYGGDIYRKWGDAVQHVETEYSQIVTDKEFLMPETVNQCILYLEQHPDHSSACGVQYYLEHKRLSRWNRISFEDETPRKRLEKMDETMRLNALLLTVQRTENHKQYYLNLERYGIDDIRFGEGLLELQPLLSGKVTYFSDMIEKIRDVTKQNRFGFFTNYKNSSTTRYPLFDKYPTERIAEYQQKTTKCISEICSTVNISDDVEIKKITPVVHNIFMWWFIPADQKPKQKPEPQFSLFKKVPLLYSIWLSLPTPIQQIIMNLIKKTEINELNSADVDLVISIIRNTEKYYKKDLSILNDPNYNK